MAKRVLKHFDILAAKRAYAGGENVTELLRKQKNVLNNTSEIIETSYDLQAGSYIEYAEKYMKQATLYTSELAAIIDGHISEKDSLLDVGTGELTTLSFITQKVAHKPKNIFAFDISWSRIRKGLNYAKKNMDEDYERLIPFVADISEIPLRDKSVNITTSSHALEPNGGKLSELMSELFRVTTDKLVLFEPCYEINSKEGKQRMDRLGYIKDVDGVVEKLGGKLVEKIKINNAGNPLNPTVCFVITPPASQAASVPDDVDAADIFAVPGTNHSLRRDDEFYFSNETGLCFPILKSIPILKSNSAILASALTD